MSSNDIKALIQRLVEKHKYKPLKPGESEYVRKKFAENLPDFLKGKIDGSDIKLYMHKGSGCIGNRNLVCNGFERIVIGDYGAYVEFSEDQASDILVPLKGQEWRTEEKYKHSKYEALTTIGFKACTLETGAPLVYKQKDTVKYADYKIGKFYISVYDVWPSSSPCGYPAGYAEEDNIRVQCIERRPHYDSWWEIKFKNANGDNEVVVVKRFDFEEADLLLVLVKESLAANANIEALRIAESAFNYD